MRSHPLYETPSGAEEVVETALRFSIYCTVISGTHAEQMRHSGLAAQHKRTNDESKQKSIFCSQQVDFQSREIRDYTCQIITDVSAEQSTRRLLKIIVDTSPRHSLPRYTQKNTTTHAYAVNVSGSFSRWQQATQQQQHAPSSLPSRQRIFVCESNAFVSHCPDAPCEHESCRRIARSRLVARSRVDLALVGCLACKEANRPCNRVYLILDATVSVGTRVEHKPNELTMFRQWHNQRPAGRQVRHSLASSSTGSTRKLTTILRAVCGGS